MAQNQSPGVVPRFLLDPALEPVFDGFTRLASKVLKVPAALITVLNADRQFFKSHCGLPRDIAEERGTPISHSFCRHVVAFAEDLVVNNALEHPLVKDNPAIREMGVRAYLGSPVFNVDGKAVGAFCVIDTVTRAWTVHERELVKALAAQVTNEVMFRTLTGEGRAASAAATTRDIIPGPEAGNLAEIRDLRTPINAVLMSLQALGSTGTMSAEQTRFLKAAEKNALLAMARVDLMRESEEA